MSFLRIVIALACAALLLAVPAASAQDNSAVDEYTENPPSPGGENPGGNEGTGGSGGSGGEGDGDGGSSLPPSTVDQLESLGPDGAAAAGLANELAPDGKAGGGNRNGSGGSSTGAGSRLADDAESGGGSPIADILEGLSGDSDSSGLGPVLPIVLIAILIAGLALAVARWRRGDTPDTPAT